MGAGRCQPSRACLGGMESIRDRERAERFRGSDIPATHFSQAPPQLHVVGEPQGCGGPKRFPRGFLGLDNIGVFDRSVGCPGGGQIEQADGTGWMAMYSLNMMTIAMELAVDDPAYEDVASKFWEHFIYIANAINHMGNDGVSMWSE